MKLTLYFLLLFTILLSACSGKRYRHYSYSKRNHQKVIRAKLNKRIKVVALKQFKPELNFSKTRYKHDSIGIVLLEEYDKVKSRPERKKKKSTNKLLLAKNKTQLIDTTKTLSVPKPNINANASMVFGIISLFIALFSAFFLPLLFLAFVFGLAAFFFGNAALQEIRNSPNIYSNKGAAILGRIIGSIYVIALGIALVVILLYALLLIILFGGYILSFLLI